MSILVSKIPDGSICRNMKYSADGHEMYIDKKDIPPFVFGDFRI